MNIDQIRLVVTQAYNSKKWAAKVARMPDKQVYAIYRSLMEKVDK